jgi:hypothetical protein
MRARHWIPIVAGASLGIGLGLSGLNLPERVRDMFDLTGDFVLVPWVSVAAALVTAHFGFRALAKRGRPWLSDHFRWPADAPISWRFVLGCIAIGIAIGLAGLSIEGMLANLLFLQPEVLLFFFSSLAGYFVASRFQ